jgi:hypothetical protein
MYAFSCSQVSSLPAATVKPAVPGIYEKTGKQRYELVKAPISVFGATPSCYRLLWRTLGRYICKCHPLCSSPNAPTSIGWRVRNYQTVSPGRQDLQIAAGCWFSLSSLGERRSQPGSSICSWCDPMMLRQRETTVHGLRFTMKALNYFAAQPSVLASARQTLIARISYHYRAGRRSQTGSSCYVCHRYRGAV